MEHLLSLPKYNCKPDRPDNRDRNLYSSAPKATKNPLSSVPTRTDLRNFCSTVEDQLQVGSCTANSSVGNLEFLEKKLHQSGSFTFVDFSRLFVYYNTRKIENTVNEDSGASIRDTVKSIATYGACDEKLWPYDESKVFAAPTQACYDIAKKHTVTEYHRITTLNDMILCLAEGYPFIFGFQVYSYFESPQMAKTGVLNLPKKGEKLLGGHAVLAVGYNLLTKTFLVRNSWGINWGMQGYFTIPFDYLSNVNLAGDCWTLRKQI